MTLAAELMQGSPSVTVGATVAAAGERLAGGGHEILPVIQDDARRNPIGVISNAEVEACRAAGHDPSACPVERHLGRDFALAFPDDRVESGPAGRGGRPLRAVIVIGEDRRLQGIIPARGRSLYIEPAHRVEPMAGGMQGMELIWRCGDCGYVVHRPASPPERCPDCGAPREHFVLITED